MGCFVADFNRTLDLVLYRSIELGLCISRLVPMSASRSAAMSAPISALAMKKDRVSRLLIKAHPTPSIVFEPSVNVMEHPSYEDRWPIARNID